MTGTLVSPGDSVALTIEEVADQLSFQEGRRVSVEEVRRIEWQALHKLRRALMAKGLGFDDLRLDAFAGPRIGP